MNLPPDDLLPLALDPARGGEANEAVAGDPEAERELFEIRSHLRLHDAMPEISPDPATWRRLRASIQGEASEPRRLPRYWMVAAAALLLVALFWRGGAVPGPLQLLHGDVVIDGNGEGSCTKVSRLKIGDAITVTFDADTTFVLKTPHRLALRAGRLLFDGHPGPGGFSIEAGDVVLDVSGTVFVVGRAGDAVTVSVEEGSVSWTCREKTALLRAGRTARFDGGFAEGPLPADARAWLSEAAFRAELADPETLVFVLRNEMPDPIEVPPPTGGEPLLHAKYAGHVFPLAVPAGGELGDRPVRLPPGGELELRFPLPRPVPAGVEVEVVYRGRKATIPPVR